MKWNHLGTHIFVYFHEQSKGDLKSEAETYVGPMSRKNQWPEMGSRKDPEPKQLGVKGGSDATLVVRGTHEMQMKCSEQSLACVKTQLMLMCLK